MASEAAEGLDKTNPRYYLMRGISTYYTPEAFGGGADKAITLLEKAFTLYDTRKEKDETYPDWGYDLTAGYLNMAYAKRNNEGDMDKAKMYLEKGMKKDPDSSFLKMLSKKKDETK
jgi:tetratricopeptide (TPR) repeat protein